MPITDGRDPAAPAPAPGRPDRWRRLRARAGRYARARAADLFGDPGPLRAARDGIARASAVLDLVSDRPPAAGRAEEEGRRVVAPGRSPPSRAVATRRRPPPRGRFSRPPSSAC